MSPRAEWDWIIAWGLLLTSAKIHGRTVDRRYLETETHLNLELPKRACKKCGRSYSHYCVPCEYRNGGEITGRTDDAPRDLIDQMNTMLNPKVGRNALDGQLRSMRVPYQCASYEA